MAAPAEDDDLWRETEVLLEKMGIELVDIEYLGSGGGLLLRVTIDRPEGVDLDACADVSEALGSLFEKLDPVEGEYTLEVSSPGLERPLRRPRHWIRAVGETVKVKLSDGAGVVKGVLVGADEHRAHVETDAGVVAIDYPSVVSARTLFDWDAQRG